MMLRDNPRNGALLEALLTAVANDTGDAGARLLKVGVETGAHLGFEVEYAETVDYSDQEVRIGASWRAIAGALLSDLQRP